MSSKKQPYFNFTLPKLTDKEIEALTVEDIKNLQDEQIAHSFIVERTLFNIIKHYAKCFIPSCKYLYKKLWTERNVEPERDFLDDEFDEYYDWYWRYYVYWKKKRTIKHRAYVVRRSYTRHYRFLLICHLNRYTKLAYVLTKLYWLSRYTGYNFAFMRKSDLFQMYGRTKNKNLKELLTTNQLYFKFDEINDVFDFIDETRNLKINPAIIYPICLADLYYCHITPLQYYNTKLKRTLIQERLKHLYLNILLKRIIKNFRENTDKWIDEILTTPLF